jgi:hypothetical protein
MGRTLQVFIFPTILLAVATGFALPSAARSVSRTNKLYTLPQKEEINGPAPPSSPRYESEPCEPSVENRCDLGEQLKEGLEVDYARQDPPPEPFSSKLENLTKNILNNTFLRPDTSQLFLLDRRSYARAGPFETKNLGNPPVVEDLLPQPTKIKDGFYLSLPAALLTFVGASISFPLMSGFLVHFFDRDPVLLDEIVGKLVPGISILYGTFMSLTLSILYDRQRKVQESVAQETSLLSFVLHNMVFLFRKDRDRMVRAGQITADQVRILLRESRGLEYMTIVYTDPYMKLLGLVEEEEERLVDAHGDFLSKGVSTGLGE